MRKKKEISVIVDKKQISDYKKRKALTSKSNPQTSILKIHEDKLNELENTDKLIKDINLKINKYTDEIILLKKQKALNKINNKKVNCGYVSINSLNDKIEVLKKEKEYILNNIYNDYILNTCQLIQKFIELEEREKELMNKNSDNIEQTMFEINYEKNNIIDEYKKVIDPNYTSSRNISCKENSFCDYCGILLTISYGFAGCPDCGATKNVLHQAEDLSYKEQQEMDYRPQFTYKKESHLDDWIRRLQSKENKEIPIEILDKVILEAHKQNVTDLTTLTEQKVKLYLKKLDLNDYYDNVITIINRINKRPPFVLTSEIELKIKTMFQQIQVPFEKYKCNSRKNMLSYSYLLNKFFLILKLPEFSKYFFLLKSPEKLRVQDDIFKKIVDELKITDPKTGWIFIPSV